MNRRRARVLKDVAGPARGPVLYWMSRDQRAADNWALRFAWELARERGAALAACFALAPGFPGATPRHYGFMLAGLEEVEAALLAQRVPFTLLFGEPGEEVARCAREIGASALVTDFDPLRVKRRWKEAACAALSIPVYEVDAHNVVPAWAASGKREWAARTLRPKVNRLLPEFLEGFPEPCDNLAPPPGGMPRNDWEKARAVTGAEATPGRPKSPAPGERKAAAALRSFIEERLPRYHLDRNDPSKDGQSRLSPYFHFGQLAPQRAALEVLRADAPKEARDAFLEELIVRRELADNFCLHTPDYDSLSCAPPWALETLSRHREDPRDHIYDRETFERGETHDPLWNAAQLEVAHTGRMHGYMRMYWGKKILEWSATPEEAVATAVYLNDRYALDGRDPSGYAGILWSIAGVHDRPWFERPVFGKVRFMSEAGCRRKFDVDGYIGKVRRAVAAAEGKG